MKKYSVSVHFDAVAFVEVIADSEEEAIELAEQKAESASLEIQHNSTDIYDVEDVESVFNYPLTLIDCEERVTFKNFKELQEYFNDFFAAANDDNEFEDEYEIRNWIDQSYYLTIVED